MSLCVYARIIPICITEEILDSMIVSYEKINTKNNLTITLIKEKKPPYNFYDSDIINNGFEYTQLIIFDILKDTCSISDYKNIIKFCIYLQEKIDCKILITSDAHDEICFLENRKVIWSKEKEKLFS